MAEESGSDKDQKTEEPTARRIEKSKEEGQSPFSKEVVNWFFLIGCACIALWILPYLLHSSLSELAFFIDRPHDVNLETGQLSFLFQKVLIVFSKIVFFPALILFVLLIASAYGQVHGAISLKVLKIKLDRLSPSKGFKKIFSTKSLVEFIKTLFKTAVLCVGAYFVLKEDLKKISTGGVMSFKEISKMLFDFTQEIFTFILIFLFFLAVFDFFYQRYTFMKNLRMTKQEIKEEFKESEGDPHIKGRIRQIRQERIKKNIMQNVPKATVVITNPTHISVALSFNEETLETPIVVAKGQDFMALTIREIAKKHDIPIVENPPVARDLYARVNVDQPIPEDTFKVVAEIIRFVMSLKKKAF